MGETAPVRWACPYGGKKGKVGEMQLDDRQNTPVLTPVEEHVDAPDTGKKYPTIKTCEIMQYWDYMDTKSIDEVISRIKSLKNIKTWCIITHDKDTTSDGSPKKPHFHAVLTFSNTVTIKTVADTIKLEPQYVNKIRATTLAAQMYLIHRNDPAKYQYPAKDVKASFDYVTKVDDTPIKIKREDIAAKIASGEIKRYNLVSHVSPDEYARNKRYYDNCFEYRVKLMKGLNRDMQCIFITGQSGTGKTTYAKEYATQKGFATYISSGGKNPLDNYAGEGCIILDDTRSSTWSLTDFLKLTDNHTDSLVGCRYYNKSIAECKLLIVTSCKSLDEFYSHTTDHEKEPKVQLMRRFALVVRMTHETITMCAYNAAKECHVPVMTAKNHISLRYDPAMALDFVRDFARTLGLQIHSDDTETQGEFPLITGSDDDLPDAWGV